MTLGFALILGDKSPDQVAAWEEAFAGLPDVTIRGGNLLLASADALVSPANSFGFMDGGIDWSISDMMEWKIQPVVQAMIRDKYDGEIPVGCAEVVVTGFDRFPYLVCAPTMRVPQPIAETVNAFLAMRATLLAVRRFNAANNDAIKTVAIPGLGTGFGKMPADRCARQMRSAYDMVASGKPTSYPSLSRAIDDEKKYKL